MLTINGGSSSIRFALFTVGKVPRLRLAGKIERIGFAGTTFLLTHPHNSPQTSINIAVGSYSGAVDFLLDWLDAQPLFASAQAVSHRIVHGMERSDPERLTPKLLAELRRIIPFAPEHLPQEIGLMEAFRTRYPKLPQVACFDTAFHRTMPTVARLLPIPRRYAANGVERYGFHGLAYAHLMQRLRTLDPAAAMGRVILAHLGNGASLAAVQGGRSMDTSMGLTPASGLMMGTRTGDVDPGLVGYLARTAGMSAVRFEQLANHESGLLGVSATSADMRDLLASESTDPAAAEAVALFCYQAKKWIGSFAAALGGLDTLVFSGGVGENSSVVRSRICSGLSFLGVILDNRRNARSAAIISNATSPVPVRVIAANEELMLAKLAIQVLGLVEAKGIQSGN
jgi:acetate kinase